MASLDEVRAGFARSEGLPFAAALTGAGIPGVLAEHDVVCRDRVFDPATTTWGFLGPVLSDDHSCRDAVARAIAHRAASRAPACSPNTASYCSARGRLPAGVLRTPARRTAERFTVITTVLDPAVDGGQVGELYRRRWGGAVDIRSIKSTRQRDVLRCKTPEMVEKQVWAHLLAYHLLRTVMAVAARASGIEPRQVSLKGPSRRRRRSPRRSGRPGRRTARGWSTRCSRSSPVTA